MRSVTLPEHALEKAIAGLGDGPVVMVNLLTFRDSPLLPGRFPGSKAVSPCRLLPGICRRIRPNRGSPGDCL